MPERLRLATRTGSSVIGSSVLAARRTSGTSNTNGLGERLLGTRQVNRGVQEPFDEEPFGEEHSDGKHLDGKQD